MKDYTKLKKWQLKIISFFFGIKECFRKHTAAFLCLIVFICTLAGVIIFLFDLNNPEPTIQSNDILTFVLSIMTLIGTFFLGYYAFRQGEIANEMSRQMSINDLRRHRAEVTPSLIVLDMTWLDEPDFDCQIRECGYIDYKKMDDDADFDEVECDVHFLYVSLMNTQNEIVVLQHFNVTCEVYEQHTELEMSFDNYNLDTDIFDEKKKINYILALKIPKSIEIELPPYPMSTLPLTNNSTIDRISIKLNLMTRLGEEFTEIINAHGVLSSSRFEEISYDFPPKR